MELAECYSSFIINFACYEHVLLFIITAA